MRRLTHAQKEWMQSHDSGGISLRKLLVAAITPTFSVLFIYIYGIWGLAGPVESLQSIAYFGMVGIYLTMTLAAITTLLVSMVLHGIVKDKEKIESPVNPIIQLFALISPRPLYRVLRIFESASVVLIIVSLAELEWKWWCLAFVVSYGMFQFGYERAKSTLYGFVVSLSPENIRDIEGNLQGFVINEVLDRIDDDDEDIHIEIANKKVQLREGQSPIVTAILTVEDAPQCKIEIICDEDCVTINEMLYSDSFERLQINMSDPDFIDVVQDQIVDIAHVRRDEATVSLFDETKHE